MADTLYCADPGRDEAIRPLVEQATDFVVRSVGPTRLEAVILTGSLARGEGSVLLDEHDRRLLGDLEFLVILRPPFDWPATRRRLVELGHAATRTMGKDSTQATIEYAPAGTEYFRRNIRPCIFAFDLRTHGRVLWGRDDILGEIAPFSPRAIPPTDAIELLMNRIVEQLQLRHARKRAPEALGYQSVKLLLDIAGSALAFTGRHTPLYADRPEAFVDLLLSRPDLRAELPDAEVFLRRLTDAAQCKLRPTTELLDAWRSEHHTSPLARWATTLWVWEMRVLLNLPTASPTELVGRYLASEGLSERLKGWTKFWRHPLRPRNAFRPTTLALMLAGPSPRRALYAAALLAYWGTTGSSPGDWESDARRLLPTRVRPDINTTEREIVTLWSWLVRNN
jgi:hypothetical protein